MTETDRAPLRVAVAQLLSGPDPQSNLDLVADHAARAAAAGARLLVCPEATMRCFGPPLAEIAEPVDGPWATQLTRIADRHGLTVLAGMFTPNGDGRVRNTLRVVGGGVDTAYDKIHLYDAFGFAESTTVAPGLEPVVIDVEGVRVGLSTCYDVRFPGLYQRLADLGAEVICVAASWGAGPGKVEQWSLLTRARALDSTSYVVAAGQADPVSIGSSPTAAPTGVGHSAVIGPTGEVCAALGPEPGLLVADCDPLLVGETRARLPVLAHRRF